jgi:hypothetical protein
MIRLWRSIFMDGAHTDACLVFLSKRTVGKCGRIAEAVRQVRFLSLSMTKLGAVV